MNNQRLSIHPTRGAKYVPHPMRGRGGQHDQPPPDEYKPQSPIRANPLSLEIPAVLADLGVADTLSNHRAVAVGKALVPYAHEIRGCNWRIPLHPESNLVCIVYITAHASTCTCELHRKHDARYNSPVLDPHFLCEHTAAVRMLESEAYQEWIARNALIDPQMRVLQGRENGDCDQNRRKFFAILKSHVMKRRFREYGLDIEMVEDAYRRKYGLASRADLNDAQWAIMAAELDAMRRSNYILADRAYEMKLILSNA